MAKEVGEDIAVEAVDACRVEGSAGEASGCIDHAEGHQVMVTSDDDVEGCVIVLVLH